MNAKTWSCQPIRGRKPGSFPRFLGLSSRDGWITFSGLGLVVDSLHVEENIIGNDHFHTYPATDGFEATLFNPGMPLVSTDGCNCKLDNWFNLERYLSSSLTKSSINNLNSPVIPLIVLLFNAVTLSHDLVVFHPSCLSFKLCWSHWRT